MTTPVNSQLDTGSVFVNTGSLVKTLSFSPAAGNTLLVIVTTQGIGVPSGLVTNNSQSFTADLVQTGSCCTFYRLSGLSAGTTSLTLSIVGNDSVAFDIMEMAWALSTPTLALNTTMAGAYGTTHTTSVAVPNATDFLIGSFTGNPASFSVTAATPPTFSLFPNVLSSSVGFYWNPGAAGATTVTTTESAGTNAYPASFVSYAAASSPTFPSASSKRFNSNRHSFGLSR